MISVIIACAGSGKRMKVEKNKILLEVQGKSILQYTCEKFTSCEKIDEIILVVAKHDLTVVEELATKIIHNKPYKVVVGGSERQYSINNALQAVDVKSEIVLIHDAARPMIKVETINKLIKEVEKSSCAIVGVRVKDTIKIADENKVVSKTPNRDYLWSIQTPQGFKMDIIKAAYQRAQQEGFLGTDDASLVERLNIAVKVVEGEYTNLKVTTPEDLKIIESLLNDEVYNV